MFCPSCKDEFRAGFTRCASCDVELVESLSPAGTREPPPQPQLARPVAMQDACGFLDLTEARRNRDLLVAEGIGCEIAIRTAAGSGGDGSGDDAPLQEEYWLRVDAAKAVRAVKALGTEVVAESEGPAPFSCPACGGLVTEADEQCPHCGIALDAD